MFEDRYGLPVTTASRPACDAYGAGLDSLLSAGADYREHLGRALAADPALALAHVALARGLFMDAEIAPAREAAARARECAAGASARERSHVDAIALAIEGQGAQAFEATLAHLRLWPRDALVLAPATGVFGFYGFSGRVGREEALFGLLSSLAGDYGDDWWFGAAYGFAACETGRLGLASQCIERSLARRPRNAHAMHFLAHVMYERGESAAALQALERWLPGLPRRSLMHCHLWWHVALCALASGRTERAFAAYREGVHPAAAWGPPINVVTDGVSFLWRARLAGAEVGTDDWQEVREHARRTFPKAGVAFVDVHTLLACAATGDAEGLAQLTAQVGQRIAAGTYPPGEVVLWLAEGLAAFVEGRLEAAIERLERALPQTVRIGGSRAQRDLVELTLMAAALGCGRPEQARALVAARVDRTPDTPVAGYPG